jgi:CheY-like chemotaxis protein
VLVEATPALLVVDDDPDIREMLAIALEGEGYAVRCAGNGQEALQTLEGWRPNAILLDLSMPVMDGLTFRARQLDNERLAAIPVVVLSANGHLWNVVAQRHDGPLFPKPFDLLALLGVLESLVSGCGRPAGC